MPFFEEKQPPAILKHSVLRRYLRVFAPKVGSRARGRRVVYVDAFAGRGRYVDGDPASPAIAVALAQELASWDTPTNLDCIFIEKERDSYEALAQVVPPDRAWHDRAENRLGDVLARAHGQPLFVFIDPFGQPISFDSLTRRLLARPQGPGMATEVLVNFSVVTLQRISGRIEQRRQRAHASSVLGRFDRVMNGTWWQAQGRLLAQGAGTPEAQREAIERDLVQAYARRVAEATGYVPVVSPIWKGRWRATRPFFFLVFFTANRQGVWFYADALVDAMDEYYEAVYEDQHDLFDTPDVRRSRATDVIERNLVALAEEGPFKVLDRTLDVLRGALGDGGRREVAAAVRQRTGLGHIRAEGPTTKSKIYEAVIHPGESPGLF